MGGMGGVHLTFPTPTKAADARRYGQRLELPAHSKRQVAANSSRETEQRPFSIVRALRLSLAHLKDVDNAHEVYFVSRGTVQLRLYAPVLVESQRRRLS